jgi:hypothetical protein
MDIKTLNSSLHTSLLLKTLSHNTSISQALTYYFFSYHNNYTHPNTPTIHNNKMKWLAHFFTALPPMTTPIPNPYSLQNYITTYPFNFFHKILPTPHHPSLNTNTSTNNSSNTLTHLLHSHLPQ